MAACWCACGHSGVSAGQNQPFEIFQFSVISVP
ncbi:MAG: hypothetical protein ACI9MU_003477, partial [Alphaproteobacteria bacterium]